MYNYHYIFIAFFIVVVIFEFISVPDILSNQYMAATLNFINQYSSKLEYTTDCTQLQFIVYNNRNIIGGGKSFSNILISNLEDFNLYQIPEEPPKYSFKESEVIFVTYSSSNHYDESRMGMKALREITKNKIIYYDLGLSTKQIIEVKSLCNVEYRVFNFSRYPSFVKTLTHYNFKPILISEVYQTNDVFWFIDASLRFYNSSNLQNFYKKVSQDQFGPFVGLYPTGHSVFAVTAPGMYEYFKIDEKTLKKQQMYAAWMFVVKSSFSSQVVKWNLLCALTEDCMAPPGNKLKCKFGKDRYNYYAECHRYDQSSLNLALMNIREKYGLASPKMNDPTFEQLFRVSRGEKFTGVLNLTC